MSTLILSVRKTWKIPQNRIVCILLLVSWCDNVTYKKFMSFYDRRRQHVYVTSILWIIIIRRPANAVGCIFAGDMLIRAIVRMHLLFRSCRLLFRNSESACTSMYSENYTRKYILSTLVRDDEN